MKSLFDTCSKFYGRDPCHYFSSPRLSWDVMLKITGVKLEKNVDIDMYLFNEKGLRGGISYTAKRYCKANNKHINNDDPTKPPIDISYLDINNLYSWAMSSDLPYGEFKKLKSVDGLAQIQSANAIPLKNEFELQVVHNDYPLAPKKFAIPFDMLSDYCKKIADEHGVKKLIPSLANKNKYVLHYKNL